MKLFSELFEGKLYATTKDGVRKQVKNDREAAEVRDSYHHEKNVPGYTKPKRVVSPTKAQEDLKYKQLGHVINGHISNHIPDSDGWEESAKATKKAFPNAHHHELIDHMDKAVKKAGLAASHGDLVDDHLTAYQSMHKNDTNEDFGAIAHVAHAMAGGMAGLAVGSAAVLAAHKIRSMVHDRRAAKDKIKSMKASVKKPRPTTEETTKASAEKKLNPRGTVVTDSRGVIKRVPNPKG